MRVSINNIILPCNLITFNILQLKYLVIFQYEKFLTFAFEYVCEHMKTKSYCIL